MNLGSDETLCFIARSRGVRVAGGTWSYEPSGGIELAARQDTAMFGIRRPNCVKVTGEKVGPAKLIVRVGGLAPSFDLIVRER